MNVLKYVQTLPYYIFKFMKIIFENQYLKIIFENQYLKTNI